MHGAQQAVALEHRLDDTELTVVGFDHWQTQAADGVTEQVESGLDRSRPR